ncbi:hypothetical protein BN12_1510012 [Nostocoides japonicum T1-X7]|uniref:Uncharacterized protein n=1 Tax=Nostocoides japonicum T1-X7 TaxID=1194083 RepID=A0A077LY45_9MICO|nr:hypothetical protein BN12_1510012 [Tetrasphaera japonica T1-X7]
MRRGPARPTTVTDNVSASPRRTGRRDAAVSRISPLGSDSELIADRPTISPAAEADRRSQTQSQKRSRKPTPTGSGEDGSDTPRAHGHATGVHDIGRDSTAALLFESGLAT